MGAWSLRIEFVGREWERQGHPCVLMNIAASRTEGNPKYLNVGGPFSYLWNVLKAAARGHVIHTHTNAKGVKGNLLALVAQLICLVFGRHCVLTFHAGHQQHYFPKTGRLWIDTLMWLVFKTPRAIICNSDKVKQRIVEGYGVADSKVHPIPAFCSAYMETELEAPAGEAKQFFEEHDPVIVSYVFFYHVEFTPDLLIQCLHRLRDEYPRLGLIIMGSLEYSEEYTPLLDQLEVRPHVLMTGNQPRGQFLGLLSRGALYLRTPMGDGVTASVLEALSLQTPVVAADNGTRPSGCVLYEGGDLDDMVEKVRYVLENRDELVSKIVKPGTDDTIQREIDVLMSV
jgi:glycosyltransferase involved in cell wall biosynthesis